jgi:hypothetical protein
LATVRVTHSIGDLARDMGRIPARMVTEGSKIVKKDVRAGRTLARRYARGLSGPHGADYYKRITDEASGLSGEYGPHDGGVPVGGGWRHGTPNTELERSLDVIGPRFAKDIDDMIDGLFW